MKKYKHIFLVIILIFILNGATGFAQGQQSTDGFKTLYEKAIANAIVADSDEIYKHLLPVTKKDQQLKWENKKGEDYILVVTWQDTTTYFPKDSVLNTKDRIIWVTLVPELKNTCSRYGDNDIRLKQRLGMPPNANKKYFIEIWVRPSDLYRPCPDREITDEKCQLCFPENTDASYMAWFNKTWTDSYSSSDLFKKYPWTHLGYSYDWNPENKSHVGFSEYIIWYNKDFIVKDSYKTADYCRKKK